MPHRPAHQYVQETCGVCKRLKSTRDMMACDVVRPSLAEELDQTMPEWRSTGWICHDDLQECRRRSVEDMIRRERGQLSELDREVIESIASHETVTENTEESYEETVSLGDRIADRIASFAGSWTFILSFLFLLVAWMFVNAIPAIFTSFDPYPFILLNLFLSMTAAFQAPLIMMSQRRQEEKDRLRSQNDYQINLKAELEIRHLHEKLDHILVGQWERLSKIQAMQLELFEELSAARKPPR
ncbi:DUF1003 domain-containing protein [Rhizobium daejeonense]|uniref:DUF1003 domain-containing protein n=2 Tax=Rhizobium daejeonense TaxID=240521 RepID=A0A6M1S9G7_9HYPH|nr:DUF1003 domain-containing protein [Rhizobium daejeonense]